MVGNAKTVNRGENVKRVPSTPNASGTVQTAENWAKTWTVTRKRLTGTKSDGTCPVNAQRVRNGANS